MATSTRHLSESKLGRWFLFLRAAASNAALLYGQNKTGSTLQLLNECVSALDCAFPNNCSITREKKHARTCIVHVSWNFLRNYIWTRKTKYGTMCFQWFVGHTVYTKKMICRLGKSEFTNDFNVNPTSLGKACRPECHLTSCPFLSHLPDFPHPLYTWAPTSCPPPPPHIMVSQVATICTTNVIRSWLPKRLLAISNPIHL